jgi:hypothetical protein
MTPLEPIEILSPAHQAHLARTPYRLRLQRCLGLCMPSAFTLTLTYLGEECSAADVGAAYWS